MSENICPWGHEDCTNRDECWLCLTDSLKYKGPKKKKQGLNTRIKTKETKRQGSMSEVKSFNQIDRALNSAVTGTPNSGAGKIKGDEQIRGLVSVMGEIKTTTRKNLNKEPGKETFTIQRSWLEKLEREAKEAKMEFNYLKFSFKEHDDKFYTLTTDDVILDMIVTMESDRLKAKEAESKIDVANKRRILAEAENVKLTAEIEYLKALLKQKEDLTKDKL